MKNILFRIFILSIFSSGLAQEYSLEMSYEINYDGGIFIENDEYLQEYYVKNEKGEIIGSLILDSDKQSFKFFNVNKDQVAYERNLKGTDSPFNIRKRKSEVRQSDGNIIYYKTWNNNEERFDLYSIDNKLIGNLSENEESGDWELKRIMTLPDVIFANSFELKSEYRWISGNVNVLYFSNFKLSAKVINKKRGLLLWTDNEGNFKIRAKTGDVLSISSEGYFDKLIDIGSDDFYDVSMKKNESSKTKTYNPGVFKEKTNKVWNERQGQYIVENKKKYKKVDGLGISISRDGRLDGTSKIRLGVEKHGFEGSEGKNLIGITFGYRKSNTLVSDEYNLSDWDVGLIYGQSILKNKMKLKIGLGYDFYNYDVTESFGPFYDIGEGVYYSCGLQLNLGKITIDSYYNNYGIGYGIGFIF